MTQPWEAQKRLRAKTTSWNDSPAGRLAAFGLCFFIQQFPCGQLLLAVVLDHIEQVSPELFGPAPIPTFAWELPQGAGQHGQGVGPALRAQRTTSARDSTARAPPRSVAASAGRSGPARAGARWRGSRNSPACRPRR